MIGRRTEGWACGVLGTGSNRPEEEITNQDQAESVADVSPEWISRRTEILARRHAAPDEATSDLAARAEEAARADAGITAEEIDYLIVSTSTGDHPQPPTSGLVQPLHQVNGVLRRDLVLLGGLFGGGLPAGVSRLRSGAAA